MEFEDLFSLKLKKKLKILECHLPQILVGSLSVKVPVYRLLKCLFLS